MICTTRGIVFHTVPYSDSRVVSKIYTEDFGLQSFIIRVSRAKGGKIKSNLLQPLTQIELVINNRENRTLQTVREISCNYLYQQIADDIIKTSIALFLSEILYKSIKEEEANRPLFTFISGSLKILDLQQDGVANFHLCFLLQLAKHLGFYPQQNKAGAKSVFDLRDGVFLPSIPAHPLYMDAAESRVLEQLLDLSYENMHTCDLSGEVRRVMLNNLLRYYELHLHSLHDVKSHQVLETVLS